MEISAVGFWIVSVCGVVYFAIAKRQFDLFSIGFFSAVIYFLPGFFGVTSFHVGGIWQEIPVESETYLVFSSVLASILASGVLASSKGASIEKSHTRNDSEETFALWTLSALAAGSLLLMVASTGAELFNPYKEELMEKLNRWHILFYVSAVIGFTVSVGLRAWLFAMGFSSLLLFDLYIGFRSPVAIAVISAIALELSRKGKIRLISYWPTMLLVIGFGAFMFFYKSIFFVVKAGMWENVTERLLSPDAYMLAVMQSEPFVAQSILNEVIAKKFDSGIDHLISCVYQLILFAPELGGKVVTFNEKFQPVFFPEVDYGFAANIWAQMWSAGGWPLLISFLALFNVVLLWGSRFAKPDCLFWMGLMPGFVYWAFYLHRNELLYAVSLEKRVAMVMIITIGIAKLMSTVLNRRVKIA